MIPSGFLNSLKIAGNSPGQSSLADTLNLKPGQTIDAKVLDVKSENRVQLLLSGTRQVISGSKNPVQNRAQQETGNAKSAGPSSQLPSNESAKPLLSGQKIQASTPLPLKPGMSLTLTVVATREGPVLKPVTALPLPSSHSPGSSVTDGALKILPEEQKTARMPAAGIKPGQTVEAKILDVTPQSRAQLLVGGQKLTVSTQLPLARGMNIPMTVVQSRDGIVLKPVPDPSAPASTVTPGPAGNTGTSPAIKFPGSPAVDVQRLPVSGPGTMTESPLLPGSEKSFQTIDVHSFSPAKIFQGLSALIQAREPALNDIMMGLALKSDVRDDQFLPRIIKNMGLSLEKKLASGIGDAIENAPDKKTVPHIIKQLADQDLKAAALSLCATESDSSKASVLKHIADALDNFAQLNVKPGESGQPQDGARVLLPFPVWAEDGFDFGQLMVDMGKNSTENTEKKMLSISFLLNMTALGPLRADFSILDKTIAGRFLLENQGTCDYLTPRMSQLRQRLAEIGYQAGKIHCQVARPEQISPTSLMLSMKTPDDMQGLNIVV